MQAHRIRIGLCVGLLGPALAGLSAPAVAQQPERDASVSGSVMQEVVVTARKRDERLLDVPISVSALTADDIEAQNITSLFDLARTTPGLYVTNTLSGSARTDRSFPTYVLRGLNPSSTNTPTTRVFIDGAPFPTAQVGGLDDLERVETLFGPQPAYFGRQAFAGAINLVTRDPGEELGGSVNVLGATDNYYDARASVEGPIIGDKLTGRASIRYYTRDGSFDNQAVAGAVPGTMGEQSTRSVTLTGVAKPVDGLRIKAMYMAWEDEDGPGPTGYVGPDQSNCTTPAGIWFCGEAPRLSSRQPAANTIVDSAIQNWLNLLNTPDQRLLFDAPNEYGFEREASYSSLNIDYTFGNGMTLSSITAYGEDEFSTLTDLDNQDSSGVPNPNLAFAGIYGQTFFNFPFIVQQANEELSQELRLTSSGEGRLRWLVGAAYNETERTTALAGLINGGAFRFRTVQDPAYRSDSFGVFAGLTYDITERLTANVEGRYQRDTGESPLQSVKATYNNFTPRLSLQYRFSDDLMAYVTYSEAVNHSGTFNSSLLQLPPEAAQELLERFGGKVAVDPEQLTNYELGLKGSFFGGAVSLTAAAYHMEWEDQIVANNVILFPNGVQTLVSVTLNNGLSYVDGLEFDLRWRPLEGLDFALSGALNDTEIKEGPCAICGTITGSDNVIGRELPNVSRVQANFAASYTNTLPWAPEWDWFARIDNSYKEGTFATADNLVYSPDLLFTNVRIGASRGGLRVEAFVDNLFDEDGFTALSPYGDNANPNRDPTRTTDALLGGLPFLRVYGLRVRYAFGTP